MTIYFIQNPRPGIQPLQPVEEVIFQGREVDMYDRSTIRRVNDLKPLYIITQPNEYKDRMMFKKDVFLSEGPCGPITLDQYRKLWNKRHTVELTSTRPHKRAKTSQESSTPSSSSPQLGSKEYWECVEELTSLRMRAEAIKAELAAKILKL